MQIELEIINRSNKYGDFVTGISVEDGLSSDKLNDDGTMRVVGARDVVQAIPILWWKLPTPTQGIDSYEGRTHASVFNLQCRKLSAVDATRAGIPLKLEPLRGAQFSVNGDKLSISSASSFLGPIEKFPFKIDLRAAWFLEKTCTLGLLLEYGDDIRIATITSDAQPPRVATAEGRIAGSSFNNLLERGMWTSAFNARLSLYPDFFDATDDHREIYLSTADRVRLPQVSAARSCVCCGNTADSLEHCVPKWLTDALRAQPLTARIICEDCNYRLGRSMEEAVARKFQHSGFHGLAGTSLFKSWSIKTALFLSVASGVRIDSRWVPRVINGEIPNGFKSLTTTRVEFAEKGYAYGVAHFAEQRRQQGYYLASLAMDGLIMVVYRIPDDDTEQRFEEAFLIETNNHRTEFSKFFDGLMSAISGMPLEHSASSTRRPSSRN